MNTSHSSVPTRGRNLHNYPLLAAGYFSLAFAVFQISAIWWPLATLKYFGGPAEMSLQRPLAYAALCLGVGLIVGGFGFYSLSGAGTIRRLPLLRTALIFVTAIYLLRGLLAIPQVPFVLRHPDLLRMLIFSLIALCVGMVYVVGVVHLYKYGRPGETTPLGV